MASVTAVFLLLLSLSVGVGLLLYLFVRRERHGEQMDRASAERRARRDTSDDER